MKIVFSCIVVLALLMGGYLVMNITRPAENNADVSEPYEDNVRIVDGIQIIELRAKGGYLPKVSRAKAGVPTILRVNTSGTFDCSSSLRIPSMSISQNLPATGVTDISIGSLTLGGIDGTCGMGMYPFQINVEQ